MAGQCLDEAAARKADCPARLQLVYHQIMGDKPPPHVPILMNCFYEPTQPSMRRCIDFGRSLMNALEAWPGEARVALIASGEPLALRVR